MSSTCSRPARTSRVLPEDERFAGDRQFATTLARGLALLKCFSPDRCELTHGELARQLGLPKATITRLTYTLCSLGYLRQSESQGYQLGSAVVSLAYPLLANLALRQTARPLMKELSDAVGGSVSIAVRDRLDMVFIEASRSRWAASRRIADVGLSYPMVATAAGCAHLAACGKAEHRAVRHEIRLRQPALWARHHATLEEGLALHRRVGFCAVYAALRPEVAAVARACRPTKGGPLLVFNCVVPTARFDRRQLIDEVGPRLVRMVRQIDGEAPDGMA